MVCQHAVTYCVVSVSGGPLQLAMLREPMSHVVQVFFTMLQTCLLVKDLLWSCIVAWLLLRLPQARPMISLNSVLLIIFIVLSAASPTIHCIITCQSTRSLVRELTCYVRLLYRCMALQKVLVFILNYDSTFHPTLLCYLFLSVTRCQHSLHIQLPPGL